MNGYPGRRRGRQIAKLRQHMKEYFASRKFNVSKKHPFILAKWEDWPSNIIDPRVVKYIKNIKNRQHFALHKYIHHGLSSQAFLFNLCLWHNKNVGFGS